MPDLNTDAHIANIKEVFHVLVQRIRQARGMADVEIRDGQGLVDVEM